jgi:chromosome partitioning protein
MRRIAVINQKGGVGKTTTTANLGAALARLGHRTLVCDLDPQCNLTVHLDLDPRVVAPSLYDLFHGKAGLDEVVQPVGSQEGFFVAPSSVDLAGVELELVNAVGREVILAGALEAPAWQERTRADIVLMDCPPSLGLISLNALVACDELLVPVQAEFFALQGLGKLLEVVDLVQRRLNPRLRISAMVSCRHDPSTNLGKAVVADIKAHFGEVFLTTVIRRDVKLAEAPSHGRTIFEYDPECRGAQDYLALAKELLGEKDGAPSCAREAGTGQAPERAEAADAEGAEPPAVDPANRAPTP